MHAIRNYVLKLLAVRNIVASPQTFGMNISEITNQPYFQTVSIDKSIDNSTIARLANISESELLTLNPAFNAPVFIPKNNRKLLLSVSVVSAFEKNYRWFFIGTTGLLGICCLITLLVILGIVLLMNRLVDFIDSSTAFKRPEDNTSDHSNLSSDS